MEEKAFYNDLKGSVELITFGSESLGLLKREQEYLGSVLFTTDLSTVSLPVPSKYAQENRIELYFLLPDYWPLETSSSLFAWAAETLIEIKNYLAKEFKHFNNQIVDLDKKVSSDFKKNIVDQANIHLYI